MAGLTKLLDATIHRTVDQKCARLEPHDLCPALNITKNLAYVKGCLYYEAMKRTYVRQLDA